MTCRRHFPALTLNLPATEAWGPKLAFKERPLALGASKWAPSPAGHLEACFVPSAPTFVSPRWRQLAPFQPARSAVARASWQGGCRSLLVCWPNSRQQPARLKPIRVCVCLGDHLERPRICILPPAWRCLQRATWRPGRDLRCARSSPPAPLGGAQLPSGGREATLLGQRTEQKGPACGALSSGRPFLTGSGAARHAARERRKGGSCRGRERELILFNVPSMARRRSDY